MIPAEAIYTAQFIVVCLGGIVSFLTIINLINGMRDPKKDQGKAGRAVDNFSFVRRGRFRKDGRP